MKKVVNFLSWCSFICITLVTGVFCVFCGAEVANYLKDTFHVEGAWCLLLIIPLVISALIVEAFILLGLKKFGRPE